MSAFVALVAINIGIVFKLDSAYHIDMISQDVLDEIDKPYKPNEQFRFSAAPFVANNTIESEVHISDARVANLKAFFRKYGSPLYDYADVMVAEADRNSFDYRLLAAIAMQESNLCKYIPEDSYNCWGWGIYGDSVIRFSGYDEGIRVVSEGIKKNYIDHGLVTASMIMKKYTPSSNGSWERSVNHFLKSLQ